MNNYLSEYYNLRKLIPNQLSCVRRYTNKLTSSILHDIEIVVQTTTDSTE